LGDVLGGLSRLEASGCLEIAELPPSRLVHRVEIRAGKVSSVLSAVGPSLGRILGSGSPCPIAPGRTTAEAWVDAGRAVQTVRAALERQRQVRLEYLFALRDARLSFRARSPAAGVGVELDGLSSNDVLPGRPRYVPRNPMPTPPAREQLLHTLGLKRGASPDDVKQAFRELARQLHPDVHQAAKSAEERGRLAQRFAQVSRAYHELLG
jgi:hypothetical protein